MVCDICGLGKDEPHHIICGRCEEKLKCEYCGKDYKTYNIGKILGNEDKWGCTECAKKIEAI